ncbi:hypothetical protein BURMUCGD1_5991 [Burkholderia multivorans CGD1]|nr:hypothetical protein BURMUCGD1_5991 [Burkholderia multivorans CGD1]
MQSNGFIAVLAPNPKMYSSTPTHIARNCTLVGVPDVCTRGRLFCF